MNSHRDTKDDNATMGSYRQLEIDCQELKEDYSHLISLSTEPYHDIDFAVQLGESLMNNTSLKRLTLTTFDMSATDARALAIGVAGSKLKAVEISGRINWCDEARKRIARKILYEGVISSLTIQDIMLQCVQAREMLDSFGNALVEMKLLRIIRVLQSDYWSRQFGQQLSDFMLRKSSLITLFLDDIPMKDIGFTAIARGMRDNVTLKNLHVKKCGIGNDSVRMLVAHWHPNSPLQCLSLAVNKIGPKGVQMLMQAIVHHPALKSLDLNGNAKMGFEGLRIIGEALSAQLSVKYVEVLGCATYDSDYKNGAAEAQEKAWLPAKQALLEGLTRNHLIEAFEVNSFFTHLQTVPGSFGKEIYFYTSLNRMGRRLLSTYHGLASTVWCHILSNCQQQYLFATDLTYFFLREQPSLVQPIRKRQRNERDANLY
jgi:hypothetical protein